MLDNTITLAVDVLNNGTAVNKVFSRHDDSMPNRSRYISDTHSLVSRDMIDFYRTPPKKSGNFNGVAKTGFKFTIDQVVPAADASNIVAPQIAEVSFSLPIGFTTAQLIVLRQRIVSLLDNDTLMKRLNEQQEV